MSNFPSGLSLDYTCGWSSHSQDYVHFKAMSFYYQSPILFQLTSSLILQYFFYFLYSHYSNQTNPISEFQQFCVLEKQIQLKLNLRQISEVVDKLKFFFHVFFKYSFLQAFLFYKVTFFFLYFVFVYTFSFITRAPERKLASLRLVYS